MQLHHSFKVPTSVDDAWRVLRDIERIGPCMPGATIDEVDGEEFTGRVKVRVGPMQVAYRGRAAFTEVDEERHRAVIEAKGQETRGAGTANATITAELVDREGETEVTVLTDLAITGKPAQFGRGVMADVGGKLLGQFADCLSEELGRKEPEPTAAGEAAGGPATGERPAAERARPEAPEVTPAFARMGVEEEAAAPEGPAVDLLDIARGPVLKRALPALGALALVLLLARLLGRRD